MASCYVVLTVLLMSSFSISKCTGSSSYHDYSYTTELDPRLARGLQPHTHHRHNYTLPNVNGTAFWTSAFSQLMNLLMVQPKPDTDGSALPTNPPSGSSTPPPSTTESEWDDWDLDDFDSCRDALQSVIRRLSMLRT